MAKSLSNIKTLGEEDPKDEKKKKRKSKDDKETSTQYSIYSGIIGDKGAKDNPKESEVIENMVEYLKNNNPPESDRPSNVYRPKWSHTTINYNRKNKQSIA